MDVSSPSRRMRMQCAGSLTLGVFPTATSMRIGMVMRLVAFSIRNTSRRGRPAASRHNQPVMFSATTFKKVMFPEMSVQMTASPMQLSVTWARSFSANNASSMVLRSTA